jgi:hypothetical protein
MPLEFTSITHEKMFFILTEPREDKKITKEMTKNQAYQGRDGDSGKIVGFTPYEMDWKDSGKIVRWRL